MSNSKNDQQNSTNYKEAFSLFDKRGTGQVALESLGDLLRACGQNPTMAEIADLEKTVGGDCKLALHIHHRACLTPHQLRTMRSSKSSTDPTDSATPANPKNTAADSRCSTRT